jgi:hypothetical protein
MTPEMRWLAIADAIKHLPDIADTSKTAKRTFIASLPSRARLLMEQPFSKSPNKHDPVPTFTGDARLRHILVPLLKSGFIDSRHDLDNVVRSSPIIRQAHQLLTNFGHVDFRLLQTLWTNDSWSKLESLNHHRIAMMTACTIHYDLDIPSVVRFISGPYTGAF